MIPPITVDRGRWLGNPANHAPIPAHLPRQWHYCIHHSEVQTSCHSSSRSTGCPTPRRSLYFEAIFDSQRSWSAPDASCDQVHWETSPWNCRKGTKRMSFGFLKLITRNFTQARTGETSDIAYLMPILWLRWRQLKRSGKNSKNSQTELSRNTQTAQKDFIFITHSKSVDYIRL